MNHLQPSSNISALAVQGCVITVANFPKEEKEVLREQITAHGGLYRTVRFFFFFITLKPRVE